MSKFFYLTFKSLFVDKLKLLANSIDLDLKKNINEIDINKLKYQRIIMKQVINNLQADLPIFKGLDSPDLEELYRIFVVARNLVAEKIRYDTNYARDYVIWEYLIRMIFKTNWRFHSKILQSPELYPEYYQVPILEKDINFIESARFDLDLCELPSRMKSSIETFEFHIIQDLFIFLESIYLVIIFFCFFLIIIIIKKMFKNK